MPIMTREARGTSDPESALAPLYRRILGDRFDELPPVLQRFHDSSGGGEASGKFEVTGSGGRLRNLITWLMGLPPVASHVPVELKVAVEGSRERWSRSFGSHLMETVQSTSDGLLIEAAGPVRFAFQIEIENQVTHFRCARVSCWSIPLPRFVAPRVEATVESRDQGWHIHVRVAIPGAGVIRDYAGLMIPAARSSVVAPAVTLMDDSCAAATAPGSMTVRREC
jgi:hypothetical protein